MELSTSPLQRGLSASLLAVLLAAGATVGSPAETAGAQSAWHASFNEHVSSTMCPPDTPRTTLCAIALGVGSGNRIGRATEWISATVDLGKLNKGTGCAPDVATGMLTATNGDHLLLTTVGTFCQVGHGKALDRGHYRFAGGTGQFKNASGNGAYVSSVTFGPSGASGTGATTFLSVL